MLVNNDYYMLIASLPHMPPSFEVERVPIARIQLEKRLEMLNSVDSQVVFQVLDFLQWDRQHRDRTDSDVKSHYEHLVKTVMNSLVREIIAYRMDVRTITSGLRRRRLGLSPPNGVGRWVEHIRNNWEHPEFNLSREHPWIRSVAERLEKGDPLEVERHLLWATWRQWAQLAERHHFCFESLLLYLVRWEIVDRWTRLNDALGRQRFDSLLMETLGEYGSINN